MATINSALSFAVISNLLGASRDINTSVLNLSGGVKTNASVADSSVGSILAYNSTALSSANINAGQGKSLVTTAKSALDQILSLLNDQKTLATKAADASLTDVDRANLNLEFQDLVTEINRIATTTKFNNKVLLDGTASGVADLTTATGQATENYTLLTTADYSVSGDTEAGDLATTNVFTPVATTAVGKTAGYATLDFATITAGAVTNAAITIGGDVVTFSAGAGSSAAVVAAAFVAAANTAATDINNTDVRKFTYVVSGSTVLVTGADLGTSADTTGFSLTARGGDGATTGISADAALFGGDPIDVTSGRSAETIASGSVSVATIGTLRTLASGYTATIDDNLQGQLTNLTATLDTSGTNNTVIFTADINGQTYTSQAVTLFGDVGYNGKGAIIKAAQDITFYNASGPQDSANEYTNNAFTLTVGAADIDLTASSGTQDAFQTSLSTVAQGFETQLDANRINQSRSLILPVTNASGGNYTVAAAADTTFEGILGFDAVGANVKGNINFIGDIYGTDGNVTNIGPFSYNISTHTITTTVNGEVYTSDLSTSAADIASLTTEGLANGDGTGGFNTATNLLTVGTGTTAGGTATTIVFHSASTTDGKQLRLDLSNLTDKAIELSSPAQATTFTDDLDTLFGVANNPSLSFQVGYGSTDTIGVSLANSQTTALYKDDAGAGKTLDISTVAGANEASAVLDNAVSGVLTRIATASSSVSSFTSAITINNVQINNFDAASNTLLNTDYALESSLLANATLRYNAGISVLVQNQQNLESLLKLLS